MTRMAYLALAIGLAACSSSDTGNHMAPAPFTFNGTWMGSAGGDSVTVVATQTDTAVSGTGTAVISDGTFQFALTGISKSPAITLMVNLPCDLSATFVGTYVSADSVTGMLTQGGSTFPFGLKKQ